MIERVAQAIYDKPTFDGDQIAVHLSNSMIIDASTTGVEDTRELVMHVCRDAARAAILEMREPTEDMVAAARSHHEGEAYLPYSLWRAMIDAALKGEAE